MHTKSRRLRYKYCGLRFETVAVSIAYLLDMRTDSIKTAFFHKCIFGRQSFCLTYIFLCVFLRFGDRFIYLALDWGEPITATATVFISAGVVTSLYIVVVLMTVLRNLLSRKLKNDNLYIIS